MEEIQCPLCNGWMENLPDEACVICRRCGTRARFRGEELEALLIPNYRLRLLELERRNIELTREIEQEGRKGPMRDQQLLHFMHMERQRLLSEYSFLSYFSTFVDKW